jgi:hypothetical protein
MVEVHRHRQSAVIEDDGRVGERADEVGELGELVVKGAGVEAQLASRELRESGAEARIAEQPLVAAGTAGSGTALGWGWWFAAWRTPRNRPDASWSA